MTTATPVLLVDGHNLLHRAFYGFPARIRSRSGEDRTTIFGFFALLRAASLELDTRPEVVVAFDGHDGARERRAVLPSYKPFSAHLPPDDFEDLPLIREMLTSLGISWIEEPDLEADDVIASGISAHPKQRFVILSTDKDFYELLANRVILLNTARRQGDRIVTASHVAERYAVEPVQWCDFRALTGDPADGVPGIRGVGAKRGAQLLAGGLTLEGLLASDRLTPKWAAGIPALGDELLIWRSVIRLRRDVWRRSFPRVRTRSSTIPAAPDVLARFDLW